MTIENKETMKSCFGEHGSFARCNNCDDASACRASQAKKRLASYLRAPKRPIPEDVQVSSSKSISLSDESLLAEIDKLDEEAAPQPIHPHMSSLFPKKQASTLPDAEVVSPPPATRAAEITSPIEGIRLPLMEEESLSATNGKSLSTGKEKESYSFPSDVTGEVLKRIQAKTSVELGEWLEKIFNTHILSAEDYTGTQRRLVCAIHLELNRRGAPDSGKGTLAPRFRE